MIDAYMQAYKIPDDQRQQFGALRLRPVEVGSHAVEAGLRFPIDLVLLRRERDDAA